MMTVSELIQEQYRITFSKLMNQYYPGIWVQEGDLKAIDERFVLLEIDINQETIGFLQTFADKDDLETTATEWLWKAVKDESVYPNFRSMKAFDLQISMELAPAIKYY